MEIAKKNKSYAERYIDRAMNDGVERTSSGIIDAIMTRIETHGGTFNYVPTERTPWRRGSEEGRDQRDLAFWRFLMRSMFVVQNMDFTTTIRLSKVGLGCFKERSRSFGCRS